MDNRVDEELKRQLLAYCLANKGVFRGEHVENMKTVKPEDLFAI